MSAPSATEQLLREAFERARQRPGEPFDEDRFLAFLTEPPARSGRRCADTFGGRRRFVRFVHEVQFDLGVCLSYEEWEKGYTLSEFVALVTRKAANRPALIRLARKRYDDARRQPYMAPVALALVCMRSHSPCGCRSSGSSASSRGMMCGTTVRCLRRSNPASPDPSLFNQTRHNTRARRVIRWNPPTPHAGEHASACLCVSPTGRVRLRLPRIRGTGDSR